MSMKNNYLEFPSEPHLVAVSWNDTTSVQKEPVSELKQGETQVLQSVLRM